MYRKAFLYLIISNYIDLLKINPAFKTKNRLSYKKMSIKQTSQMKQLYERVHVARATIPSLDMGEKVYYFLK